MIEKVREKGELRVHYRSRKEAVEVYNRVPEDISESIAPWLNDKEL